MSYIKDSVESSTGVRTLCLEKAVEVYKELYTANVKDVELVGERIVNIAKEFEKFIIGE